MTDLRTTPGRAIRACVVLVALVIQLVCVSAHAEWYQESASGAIETIRAAVPNAELIAVLDDGAGQRHSAQGRAVTGLFVDFGLAQNKGEFAQAWSQLAGMFGLDNARAFDELFGKRMLLVAQGASPVGLGDWAIATVVPTPLALDVLKKLGAKGRDIVSGQTVYAIEGGAYRFSLLKPRQADKGDAYRLIVFCPRDSDELLRHLIRGLVTPTGWDRVVGLGKFTKPSITGVLINERAEVARLETALTDAGWKGLARFELPNFEMRSSGWSGQEFARLSENAWLSMADEVDLAQVADSPIAAILPIDGDRLRQLAPHCTGRVYLRVLPEGEQSAALSICLEMDGTPEAGALADKAVRDIAGLLTASPDAVPDYRGFMPNAVRTAPIRGDFSRDVLKPMIGPTPTLAWRTATKGNTSWWTTRIAPGGSPHTESLDLLYEHLPAGDTGGSIVSLGKLNPGPIVGMMERGAGAVNSIEPTARRIEAVEWSSHQSGTQLEVLFNVRMAGE